MLTTWHASFCLFSFGSAEAPGEIVGCVDSNLRMQLHSIELEDFVA
jgi:hypothetical protein